MPNKYRIVRKPWPGGVEVQIRTWWWPWWRDLHNCGLDEALAREVMETHRKHGTVYRVIECDE